MTDDCGDESGEAIVHLLLGSNQYYPTHDNTLRVFADKQRAEAICEELNDVGGPDFRDQYEALRDEYGWLPKYHREFYNVKSYEVDRRD